MVLGESDFPRLEDTRQVIFMVFKHHVYIPWDFVLLYCNVTDTNVKIGIIRNSGRSIKEFLLLRYVHFRISASPVMLQFEVEEFTTQSKLKNFKNVMIKVDYRISNFGSWIHQKVYRNS